jgi:LuxR family maltose regulon positive regulatory protein
VLAHDPCREEAHATLMRCFARLNQRTQALRQFELCCSLLRRDLGVEPTPELLALHTQIASGKLV